MKTELIISDFDGTLVDTQEANFQAYKKVLSHFNISLTEDMYHRLFGMRLKEFMQYIGINDANMIEQIKEMKARIYPNYFNLIRTNNQLLEFIALMKRNGVKTALASTAQKQNIYNLLDYIKQSSLFDLIITGSDVMESKPNPECFLSIMSHFNCKAEATLIFEDSPVGIEAAIQSQAQYIQICKF